MAVYAVKVGQKKGKFYNWTDCAKSVLGFSGAEYKKFSTEQEADEYLNGVPKKKFTGLTGVTFVDIRQQQSEDVSDAPEPAVTKPVSNSKVKNIEDDLDEDSCCAYVDGSYEESTGYFGFGCLLLSRYDKFEFNGANNTSEYAEFRNVAGECFAAMCAVVKAYELGFKNITIVHDYCGIEAWVTGDWKAKKEFTQFYRKFMRAYSQKLHIKFQWVKGHSNSQGNDIADKLAKNAIHNRTLFNPNVYVYSDLV